MFRFACLVILIWPLFVMADEPPSAVGPLLKLYRSGKLPAERQATVLEMISSRGNEHDLRVVWDKVLDPAAMTAAVRLKAMAGLADAANTRKVKPAGDLEGIISLIQSPEAAIRLAAVKLAAACQVVAAGPELQRLAIDETAGRELQQAAIAGLVSLGGESSRQTLMQLSETAPAMALRMQAVAGLVGFDLKSAAQQGAKVLAASSPQDDPGPLLDAFFNRKEGSDELAAALKSVKISVDVAKRALRTMYSVGRSDGALSEVLSQAAGIAADAPPPTQEEVVKLTAKVAAKGNPQRGETIFRRADISCQRCHSINRAGGQVGPDLSAVGGSSPLDYIANSILNPNLAVKEQYVTRVFELSDGKVYSGVVIDRDETRVRMRDAQGKVIIIPTADIEEETEGKSMMPQGLTKFLTQDELLDLIRFVSELGKPGDYAVQTTPRIQRWQKLVNPRGELTSSVPHLEHIRELVLGSAPEVWSSVYGKVNGALPLAELNSTSGPATVILRGEIQVNEPGPIAFEMECGEPFQAWVDSQSIAEPKRFETTLESGRHVVIVRVELSGNTDGELRVNLSRPAGSTAQFEVISGM